MRFAILLLLICVNAVCDTHIWVDASNDGTDFRAHIFNEGDRTIADYHLSIYEKKNIDQISLLSKIDFFLKNKTAASAIDNEIRDLQKSYILNSSNRLLLFEFLKTQAAASKSLCHIYANDISLKNSEPFFDSSCTLMRVSLKDTNPILTKFDYLLIDGNKIEIEASPYFFSSGQEHQFVFVSNRYKTLEITATTKALKKTSVSLTPWIEGQCDDDFKTNIDLSDPVKIYFSKDCVQHAERKSSPTIAYISRNKYYIISGLLITLAALYAGSQYELGIQLP